MSQILRSGYGGPAEVTKEGNELMLELIRSKFWLQFETPGRYKSRIIVK